MSSEQDATATSAAAGPAPRSRDRRLLIAVVLAAALIAFDVLAYLVAPPFPKGGAPGQACAFPVCFINGTLEFPPPHVVLDLDPAHPLPTGAVVVGFHPSITSTIVTTWLVMGLLLAAVLLMTRGRAMVPGRLQNVAEWAYESLENFATSLGGPTARRYVPVFAAFFLFILFANWSGLVPPVGKLEELRAPTSDVNVTIGLALVAFAVFELEGIRRLGIRDYLGKFFPISEFRHGLGAGLLAMYVGLVELLLEFVKPVTLSMRLFGNIYGGEVALGVITALTLAVLPVALIALEALLNFIQALIFSVLTLMFTLLAIEGHGHEEGELAEAAAAAMVPPQSREAPSPAV